MSSLYSTGALLSMDRQRSNLNGSFSGVEDTVEDPTNINYLRPVQKMLPSKEVVGRNNQNSATFLQILHGFLIVLDEKKHFCPSVSNSSINSPWVD